MLIIFKRTERCEMCFCAYLCFPGPGDVQVSSLTGFGVVSFYVLTPKAEKAVHADIQASLTLLKQQERIL